MLHALTVCGGVLMLLLIVRLIVTILSHPFVAV